MRNCCHGALNDKNSYEDNPVTRVDPRIKLVFCFLFLIVDISTRNLYIPVTIFFFMLAGLLSIKLDRRIFLIRGMPALLIAATMLLTQIFLYGKTEMFTINLFSLHIHGYYEGLDSGLLLMSRVLAGISMVLFLTMSTSINKLIFAAKWLHLPGAFLEVLIITYRYIFVFLDEISTINNAQKVRLGHSSFSRSMNAFGNMSGIIIIRAIDKSEKLYKAMKSRGYNGQQINVHYNVGFSRSDLIITIFLSLTLAIFLVFLF